MNAIIVIYTIFFQSIIYGGFAEHTPVMLPTRAYVAIKDIQVGDTVLCYDEHDGYVSKKVINVLTRYTHDCVCIVFDNNTRIITAHNQRLYLADQRRWGMAGYLLCGDLVLSESGNSISVQRVLSIPRRVLLHDITVEGCHNFLISEHGIVAHNVVPAVAMSASIVFGSGVIELAGVTLGIGALTLGLNGLVGWLNNRKDEQECWKVDAVPDAQAYQNHEFLQDTLLETNKQRQASMSTVPMTPSSPACCPSEKNSLAGVFKTTIVDSAVQTAMEYVKQESYPTCKDEAKEKKFAEALGETEDDDDRCPHHVGCKRDHPYGLYENAGYDHKNSMGNAVRGKSQPPVDGQRALDASYVKDPESNSFQRVGVSRSQFVVLKNMQQNQLRNGRVVDIWHGYVADWKDLDEKVQRELIKRGVCNNNGKIERFNW